MQGRHLLWVAALFAAPVSAQTTMMAVAEGKTAADVASRIAAGCMSRSWQIVANSGAMVECHYSDGTAEVEQTDALIGALSGRRGYSTFTGVARFAITEIDGKVRVQATDAMVSVSAFGRQEQRDGAQLPAIRQILRSAGAWEVAQFP